MIGLDSSTSAPSPDGVRMLSCMWEAFAAAGEWPTFQFVGAHLWRDDRPEPRNIYLELADSGLVSPRIQRDRLFELRDDTRARITLNGLMYITQAQADLGRFVSVVRYLGERAARFQPASSTTLDTLSVSSDEIRLALPFSPTAAELHRQAAFIRDYAPAIWTGLGGPDLAGQWTVTLSIERARQYRNVQTVIDFIEVEREIRARDDPRQRKAPVSPAASAVPQDEAYGGASTPSDAHAKTELDAAVLLIAAQRAEETIEDLRHRVARAVEKRTFWTELLIWGTVDKDKAAISGHRSYKALADAYRAVRELNEEVPVSRLGDPIPDGEVSKLLDRMKILANASETLNAWSDELRQGQGRPRLPFLARPPVGSPRARSATIAPVEASMRTIAALAKPFGGGGGPSHSEIELAFTSADASDYLPREGNKQSRVLNGLRLLRNGGRLDPASEPLPARPEGLMAVAQQLATTLLAAQLLEYDDVSEVLDTEPADAGVPDPPRDSEPPPPQSAQERPEKGPLPTDPSAVMVVYGQDEEARKAMFGWLRSVGLKPREWTQLVAATKSGSPYIGDVLDLAFEQASAVVVLFTLDEHVLLRSSLRGGPTNWRLQSRPNVLFEAGSAFARQPTRTVLVVLGDQELPSDLAGRHYVKLGSVGALRDLASRLRAAGCPVDESGNDWLDVAQFPDRATQADPRF
jgi:predicted nucleotide-binding protein